MKIDFEGARLYVRSGPSDLRKGVTGLLAIIENEMHLDAFCPLLKCQSEYFNRLSSMSF